MALERPVERFPYVPSDPAKLRDNCYEAYNIQVQGLAQRLQSSRVENAIIGVSGGLDSTHALIVICRAMDQLGLPRSNIKAFTLPGFGTSDKTHDNAWKLMNALGVTAAEIDIKPAARQMLADIGHPFAKGEKVYDVTFENVQAGLRTDYLFRLANQHRGAGRRHRRPVGAGRWAGAPTASAITCALQSERLGLQDTDPASDPVRRGVGRRRVNTAGILHDILGTEISPELIPGDNGAVQATESFVGPYALQDFNLFYLTRLGLPAVEDRLPAWNAWHDGRRGPGPRTCRRPGRAYSMEEIHRWLELFLRRFFGNQFKRSALPNGPKISFGRLAVAARRLACAFGRESRCLACGTEGVRPHQVRRDSVPEAVDFIRESLLPDREGARIRRAGRGAPDTGPGIEWRATTA